MSVCMAYLQSNRGVVSSFARKNIILCGISTVVNLVSNLGGVFRLSAMKDTFQRSKLYVRVGISLELIEINKLYRLN